MHSKMKWMGILAVAAVAVVAMICSPAAAKTGPVPVKVFILAGQSNMEGHAATGTLDYLGEDPKYGKLLGKVKKPGGPVVVRKDVSIRYLDRKGNLTVGYGAYKGDKKAGEINLGKSFGPELGFGIVMGDLHDEEVLLIKAAWGGKSIYRDFRPPSSGLPKAEVLAAQLAQAKKRNPDATLDDVKAGYGHFYRLMLEQVSDTLGNLKTHFPAYEGQSYEIAGFVWFQGFNDQFGQANKDEYAQHMANLIKDLRKEWKVPQMPVVIGELGTGGKKGAIALAQAAAAKRPEFKGTVAFVETTQHWDFEADKMCREGVWRGPDKAKFYRIAAERPYHYLGSGKMMFLMGHDFGEAMVELLKKK